MKRMKIFVAALAIIAGVSFTACQNLEGCGCDSSNGGCSCPAGSGCSCDGTNSNDNEAAKMEKKLEGKKFKEIKDGDTWYTIIEFKQDNIYHYYSTDGEEIDDGAIGLYTFDTRFHVYVLSEANGSYILSDDGKKLSRYPSARDRHFVLVE